MNEKKIILLIPSMRGGGAEKVALLLANEFYRKSWEVVLVMTIVDGPYLKKVNKNIRIVELPHRKISRNIFALIFLLKKEKPDVLFTFMNYVNIIGSIAHKLSNTSSLLVLSEHGDLKKSYKNTGFFMRQLLRNGTRFAYPLSDKIICVSSGVESALQDFIPESAATCVIYNPIEQFEVVEKIKKPDEPYHILSIGRLTKQKNFKLLIKAFDHLISTYKINTTLTIIGDGDERKELEKIIKSKNLASKVSMPGFKDPQDYFNSSDLFVLSSDWEGFGNVIVEALSTGLPVVSTDCPSGPNEILYDGKYGELVPTNDYKALAKSIYESLSNPQKGPSKADRINRAMEFSPEKITATYLKLFNKLMHD